MVTLHGELGCVGGAIATALWPASAAWNLRCVATVTAAAMLGAANKGRSTADMLHMLSALSVATSIAAGPSLRQGPR